MKKLLGLLLVAPVALTACSIPEYKRLKPDYGTQTDVSKNTQLAVYNFLEELDALNISSTTAVSDFCGKWIDQTGTEAAWDTSTITSGKMKYGNGNMTCQQFISLDTNTLVNDGKSYAMTDIGVEKRETSIEWEGGSEHLSRTDIFKVKTARKFAIEIENEGTFSKQAANRDGLTSNQLNGQKKLYGSTVNYEFVMKKDSDAYKIFEIDVKYTV